MARLTKAEHDGILENIGNVTNASPELMDLFDKLRADFDESLKVDTEEVAREWEGKYNSMVSERDRAIGERDEARRAYRDRFFGSGDAAREAERIVDREKEDSPRTLDEVLGITQG